MKKLLACVLVSLLLHSLLLLIEANPPSGRPAPVNIDIVPKEKPEEPTPAPPAPDEIIPPTPDPQLPTDMNPDPVAEPTDPIDASLPPQDLPTPEPSPTPPTTSEPLSPITPERYDPNAPPEPFTYSEMLREQANATDPFGPDRDIDDIVREQLAQQGNSDDSVSFHELPSRFDSYFYKFARSIYGTWRYPEAAAKRGEQGIVRVTFDITRAGKIANVNLLESSGYSDLDREVLRTLRAMAPVPLPETYENELLHINGYFIYTQSGHYRLY